MKRTVTGRTQAAVNGTFKASRSVARGSRPLPQGGRSGRLSGVANTVACVSKSEIDLEDALRYHAGWSEETRAFVRNELTRIAAATFVADVHGYWNSVKVYDASGETIADILKQRSGTHRRSLPRRPTGRTRGAGSPSRSTA